MGKMTGYAIKISWLGADHTYVITDTHVYPCWGRSSGGNAICSGSGNLAVADCLSQPGSTSGIIYGITGVCHQTANRILYPSGCTVSKAKGYWASAIMYGVYGRDTAAWLIRLAACYAIKGISPNIEGGTDKRSINTGTDKAEAQLLNDILNLHKQHDIRKNIDIDIMRSKVETAAAHDVLLGKELELIARHRLGAGADSQKISALKNLQKEVLEEKEELDHAIYRKSLQGEQYAVKVNDLFAQLLSKSLRILGNEEYERLMGVPANESFGIVDSEIIKNLKL